jgi:hypothetical protein
MAGDPHFEWHYERDMLEMGTIYELGSLIRPEHLDETAVEHLRGVFANDSDHTRMVAPARRLIELWETSEQ